MKAAILIPALCLLGACSTTKPLVFEGPSAIANLEVSSDSTGTTALAWRIFKFDDATCEANDEGTLVARKIWTNSGGAFEPLALPAGRPITLGFGYIEARFAQGRECSYTLTFQPKEGETYNARFAVTNQGMACEVSLTTGQGDPVPASTPQPTCVANLQGKKYANGQPSILNYKYKAHVTR